MAACYPQTYFVTLMALRIKLCAEVWILITRSLTKNNNCPNFNRRGPNSSKQFFVLKLIPFWAVWSDQLSPRIHNCEEKKTGNWFLSEKMLWADNSFNHKLTRLNDIYPKKTIFRVNEVLVRSIEVGLTAIYFPIFRQARLTSSYKDILRRNPIEDGAISGFSGQKSVPE